MVVVVVVVVTVLVVVVDDVVKKLDFGHQTSSVGICFHKTHESGLLSNHDVLLPLLSFISANA